jgi:thymidylate kinase
MNKPFVKIAISGSHGVGKTTLVNALFKRLSIPKKNLVTEWASKVFAMSKDDPALRINQDATLEGQIWILGKQLEEEHKLEMELMAQQSRDFSGPQIILCDRSCYDSIIYTYLRLHRDKRYEWARPYFCDMLTNWANKQIHPYDVIFYTPIEFALEGSDVRPADRDFQREVDILMQRIFKAPWDRTHMVPSIDIAGETLIYTIAGHAKQRLEACLEIIDRVYRLKFGINAPIIDEGLVEMWQQQEA